MKLRRLDRLGDLEGRRVLVRVDFNVPVEAGAVADDTRLAAALDTVRELANAGARVVLASHRGRPGGEPDPELSLRPVAARLSELLDTSVRFASDCVGDEAAETVAELGEGEVVLIENLRFHPGETSCDDAFSDRLAALGDVYVGEAFGSMHRAHASTVGVALRFDPERRAAGRLVEREVAVFERLLAGTDSPTVVVIGGAKIGGKIDTLANLLDSADRILLGGGMANTFLLARDVPMGESLVEVERREMAADLLQRASVAGVAIELPVDLVIAEGPEDDGDAETVAVDAGVPGDRMALDIGPETRERFAAVLAAAHTVFWNGPMGVFERPPFDAGTREVAAAVARTPGFTVVGGGETIAAVARLGLDDEIDHLSTGGGAALEYLAGHALPGLAVLEIEG